MPATSTGLHIVSKRLKSGEPRHYVYAWRGGPCILTVTGERPEITPELLDRARAERLPRTSAGTLNALIDQYRASPAFTHLAPRTQTDYRQWLDRISRRFGRVPLRLWEGRAIKGELLEWRDELAETPRAADRGIGMLGTLLAWGEERGFVPDNPARGIRKLHKSNRADLIWQVWHFYAVAPLPAQVTRGIGLAALTGLAVVDFVPLTWEQVGETYIEGVRSKTGGTFIIPLYADLAAFLGKRGSGPILRNTLGRPWTVSGFHSVWQKHKPAGFDRTLHDLRGTFATRLMILGFTDQEIAMILGWTTERIAAIRARYVDRARVVRAMAERLSGGAVLR